MRWDLIQCGVARDRRQVEGTSLPPTRSTRSWVGQAAYACAYAYGAACMRPDATACDNGEGIARARGRARQGPEAASRTGPPAQPGLLQGIVKRRGRDSNPR